MFWNWQKLNRLLQLGEKIMTAISDFASKQNAFNDKMDSAISEIKEDIQGLNDEILKLQNASVSISPEDQDSLDQIAQRSQSIADKLEALNALTPPVAPKDDQGGSNENNAGAVDGHVSSDGADAAGAGTSDEAAADAPKPVASEGESAVAADSHGAAPVDGQVG